MFLRSLVPIGLGALLIIVGLRGSYANVVNAFGGSLTRNTTPGSLFGTSGGQQSQNNQPPGGQYGGI